MASSLYPAGWHVPPKPDWLATVPLDHRTIGCSAATSTSDDFLPETLTNSWPLGADAGLGRAALATFTTNI